MFFGVKVLVPREKESLYLESFEYNDQKPIIVLARY